MTKRRFVLQILGDGQRALCFKYLAMVSALCRHKSSRWNLYNVATQWGIIDMECAGKMICIFRVFVGRASTITERKLESFCLQSERYKIFRRIKLYAHLLQWKDLSIHRW